jgi:hypothetical protein
LLKTLTLDGVPRILTTSFLVVAPAWISAILSAFGKLPRCSTEAAQAAITAAPEKLARSEPKDRMRLTRSVDTGSTNRFSVERSRGRAHFAEEL